jgi:arylsulfatase A-like enzyme
MICSTIPALATLISLFALALTANAAPQDQPNILLIVADDMGYGDLSCYGSLQIQTPNLDRIAAAGVRCTDGYVSGPVCAPSRAGLMTGRNGSRFGFEHNLSKPDYLRDEYAGIPLDEPLMPARLKALGYRTGLVGKWHLGESVPEQHPLERGFDWFFGMLGGSHGYWPTLEKNRLLRNHSKPTEVRTPYLTDWFTLEALDFIRGNQVADGIRGGSVDAKTDGGASKSTSASNQQPWFLFLSYNTPHSPMQAKEEDVAKFAHIKGKTRRIYCAMQHCMDRNIGLLLEELERSGQLTNTLIVFMSDNGGSVEVSNAINAPLRGTKGTYLEGGIRVPMILTWPAQWEPQVFRQPLSAMDLMATFVSAAGGEPPLPGERQPREGRNKKKWPIYDSVNLDPHFRGEKTDAPHPTLYWRMGLRGSAIRDGDWKLLRPNSELPQLYNLAEDVGEERNLIEQQPEIAARLLEKFNLWETTLERNPMFQSDPYWSGYNRKLYLREYQLTQPSK